MTLDEVNQNLKNEEKWSLIVFLQFQVGQLYTVGGVSLEKTNDDTAAVVLVNEPFDNERGKGQYTHKVFNLGR